MVDRNVNVDHVAKQKKRKNLSDEYVYCSRNGIVEMHKLGGIKLSTFDDKTIDEIFSGVIKANKNLNKRVDNAKTALKTMSGKIKEIEGKMKTYGIK